MCCCTFHSNCNLMRSPPVPQNAPYLYPMIPIEEQISNIKPYLLVSDKDNPIDKFYHGCNAYTNRVY